MISHATSSTSAVSVSSSTNGCITRCWLDGMTRYCQHWRGWWRRRFSYTLVQPTRDNVVSPEAEVTIGTIVGVMWSEVCGVNEKVLSNPLPNGERLRASNKATTISGAITNIKTDRWRERRVGKDGTRGAGSGSALEVSSIFCLLVKKS